MFENISILIINSSHKSIDNVTSILKAKILSKQRPNIACLSYEELNDEMNLKSFMETFVSKKLTEFQKTIEKMRKMNEFNQLEIWKNEVNKRRMSSQMKNKLCVHEKSVSNIILDSPNDDDFYLILFDVYDCEIIKSIASLERSNLMGLVNLFPRNENYDKTGTEKSQDFWLKLLTLKYLKDFENVAFIDLSIPVESNYIHKLRSQFIYDQFCYFFYDFKLLKLSYEQYCKRLMIHEINVKKDVNDFQELQKRLNQIPHTIIKVDDIYKAIIKQIVQDESSFIIENSMENFMEIEAFGKKIYDVNDILRKGYAENPNFYSQKMLNLKDSWSDMWKHVDTQQSIEQKQIQNYFMDKIVKYLKCDKKGYDLINFYFCVLQFKNWHQNEIYEKRFVESRSVGHKKSGNDERHLKKIISDTCIEYQNLSTFPFEVEQFMNTRIDSDDMGNFYIQLLSQSAMLQHISNLKETFKQFSHQYSNIFDVQLVKFPSRSVPKIFSSNIHRKTLATPLCFRDFNDYMKYETMSENIKSFSNFFAKGDDKCPINDFLRESFVLPTSIKSQQKRNNEHCEAKSETFRETIVNEKSENVTEEKEEVYNVCNKRIEFQIEESEFQSYPLYIKSTIFSWLNMEKHLNFICTLHDKVQLLYSYDLRRNEFNNVTLRDEHATGMICSIDIGDTSQENNNNMVLAFPHEMIIKIIDVDTVEINWMELIERSHDMNINNTDGNVETKRIYFSNGFIMIHMLNGTVKIYSCNGTIYEITSKNEKFKRNSKSIRNDELTDFYKFSITSIHFLKKYVNISTFVMALPSGNRFIIENDWIVDELQPLYEVHEHCNKEEGSFQIIRDDGLRVFHANSFTKCLYGDETLITKTYYCNDDVATLFDSKKVDTTKSISILDNIWLTEAENESKILMDEVLNFVNDDYFVNINQFCQIEHKKYGSFRFVKNTVEMILFNGVTITTNQSKESSISLNEILFHLNDSKIEFYDEKCSKCSNNNKVVINIENFPTNDDDNDKCQSKILISASDVEKNIFEIEGNGRQVFYEKWDPEVCQECKITKNEHNMRKYGERWIILNRDMSGYEIFSKNPAEAFKTQNFSNNVWMESNETLFCCHNETQEINIEKKFPLELKNQNLNSTEDSSVKSSSIQSLTKSSTDVARKRSRLNVSKRIKRKTQHSKTVDLSEAKKLAEINETLDTTSPWVTVDDSSISPDIVGGRQMIQFYSNPLLDLPEAINVSAYFKLHNNKFKDLIRALRHLRKHSREKFIINVDGLMKNPVEMRTFQEHFKFIVKRSIEGYIQDKLELFRKSMARVIIEDLLENAFEKLFEGKRSTKSCIKNENRLRADDSSICFTHPVPNKSFSFV